MSGLQPSDRSVLESLAKSNALWVGEGATSALDRWLARELDEQGLPVRLSLAGWPECVSALIQARTDRPGWGQDVDSRILQLVGSLLRFSHPDGTPATVLEGTDRLGHYRSLLSACAGAFPRSPEARVIGWWLNRPDANPVPPPLPACSSSRGPLAALRASWQDDGDMLIVDHRWPESTTRFELVGRGHSWLGRGWTLSGAAATASKPRTVTWLTNSVVDLTEWSYRTGSLRCTRTALLFRGRRLALLAEQVNSRSAIDEPIESLYGLPRGLSAAPIAGRGAWSSGRPRRGPMPRCCRSRCPVSPTRPTGAGSWPTPTATA